MVTSRRIVLLTACVVLCWAASGCGSSSSSSTSGSGPGGTSSGLAFTSPTSAPLIELNAAGTATLNLTVNESVTFSLQNSSGFGPPPTGAAISPATGTSTTFTYTGTSQPCNGPPLQINVLATTTSTPPQSAVLPIAISLSPPCLAQHFAGSIYTSCPAVGTVINTLPSGGLGQVGVFFSQQTFSVGSFNGFPYGVAPFTWTLTGSLPPGLYLSAGQDSTTMVLSGTPTKPGCFTFQLQVKDSQGGVSCDPTVTTSCEPTTYYVVVEPAPLKVQLPAYPDSYDGVPYSPVALQAAGGAPPYTWSQVLIATLPPGLTLTSTPTDNYAVISGTPAIGDSNSNNSLGNGPGDYPTIINVTDSQLPYPAVGSVTVNLIDYLPPGACSSTMTPQMVQPDPGINGGILSDGAVLADNYMQGTYAFSLRGFDNQQPTVIAGSITLDGNGNVSAGEEDIVQGANASQALAVTAGTYALGVTSSAGPVSYNRGCVTLTTSAGTQTFDFTLGGCTNHYTEGGATATTDNACGMTQNGSVNMAAGTFTTGRVMEANDGTGQSAQMSGIIRAQTISSFSGGLSGPFAFGLGGWDSSSGHYAMAGYAKASANSFSSATADTDDAGVTAQLTGGSGNLGAADANGRVAGSLSFGSTSFDVALYIVSPSEAMIVTTDALSATQPVLGGEALATAGSFSSLSLQFSDILAMGGLGSSGPDVSIGLLNFDGVGDISGTLYEDAAGTLGTTALSGTYSVNPTTGRTTFIAAEPGTLGAHTFVAYLIPEPAGLIRTDCSNPASCVTGFVVGTDNTAQDGLLEFQTSTIPAIPFTNAYVAGDYVYATMESLDSMSPSLEGDVFATPSSQNSTSGSMGNSSLPFYQDVSYGCVATTCPVFIPDETLTGSYTINSNGTGNFGGGTIISISNGNVIFYIDESPVNLQPAVVVAEQ